MELWPIDRWTPSSGTEVSKNYWDTQDDDISDSILKSDKEGTNRI